MRIAIDWKKQGRTAAVLLAVSAFLAFINPYEATGSLIYPFALLYWFMMVLSGGVGAEVSMSLYDKYYENGPLAGRLAVGAIMSAFLVTSFILMIEAVFNDAVPIAYWPSVYGLVLVIATAITGVGYLADQTFTGGANPASDNADGLAAFMQRLPIKYRTATLYAISSEDHYLRVHTSAGEEMILMRLADAVRELGPANGLQVHRSWWVAIAGVADETRDNGRSLLVLHSGTQVPVSRSYRAKAKEAGLVQ